MKKPKGIEFCLRMTAGVALCVIYCLAAMPVIIAPIFGSAFVFSRCGVYWGAASVFPAFILFCMSIVVFQLGNFRLAEFLAKFAPPF